MPQRRRYDSDPISGGPPPPTSDSSQPIGVPSTVRVDGKDVPYTAPVLRYPDTTLYESQAGFRNNRWPGPTLGQQAPTYYEGDEWVPASFTADRIFQLQSSLARVGLLRGNWSGGYWDDPTRKAYKELLGMANAGGYTDADSLLNYMTQQVPKGSTGLFTVDENGNVVMTREGGGDTRAPLVTRTTDPATLRQVFRRSTIELLGEGWSPDQIDQMVHAYNSMEVQRQKQAYDLQETGGTFSDIPTPEQYAESYIQDKDPEGAAAYQGLGFATEFMKLASAPAWGVGAGG